MADASILPLLIILLHLHVLLYIVHCTAYTYSVVQSAPNVSNCARIIQCTLAIWRKRFGYTHEYSYIYPYLTCKWYTVISLTMYNTVQCTLSFLWQLKLRMVFHSHHYDSSMKMKQFYINICKNLPAYGCRLYLMRYYKHRSKVCSVHCFVHLYQTN